MKASNSVLTQGTASGEDIERYEVVDGVRVEREPTGAFETVLASWLCHVMNSFAAGKKLGLAVNEVLFVLNAARNLQRRPDVVFVSYARWTTPVVARAPAWNVVPDLVIEIVSPMVAKDIQASIMHMSQANPAWGLPRIVGELRKLGIDVAKSTMEKYRVRPQKPLLPTWKTFLNNYVKDLVSLDFFMVSTVTYKVLVVLVILAQERRQVIHCNVPEHHTAEWAAQ